MAPRPTWLGNFFGGSLGFLNYEVLTIQNIPMKLLGDETELMGSKWFDYRRLHPMQATYYFMKCYNDAYRALYRRGINADAAPYVRATKVSDFLESREKLAFWRLRQLCDRVGMRYDFFLGFAMSWFYRLADVNGKVYPPRPAQIMGNEDLIAEAMIAWEEQCNTTLQVAKDPFYRTENFVGHPNQLSHEAFVIEQVKARRHHQYSLHAALYLYDVLRVEEALRHFDVRTVGAAIREAESP